MKYQRIEPAVFLSRPNRFLAEVERNGKRETVHVKNTGRCLELLIPGRTVWLKKSLNPNRKTGFDLVAVEKYGRIINLDAQAPNQVFSEWAQAGNFLPDLTLLRPETVWGSSRFDFYWEAAGRRGFTEIKGCTLEENGLALFPDAPTERGVRHLTELAAAQSEGYDCSVYFILQMKGCRLFCPNDRTHPQFGQALRAASGAGVRIHALDCLVSPDCLLADQPVPVVLSLEEALQKMQDGVVDLA